MGQSFVVLYKNCAISAALFFAVSLVYTEIRASSNDFVARVQKGCLATSTNESWLSLERSIESEFFVYLRSSRPSYPYDG